MKIKFYDARICKPVKSGYYLTIDHKGVADRLHFSAEHNAWGAYDGVDTIPTAYGPGGEYEPAAWTAFDTAAVLEGLGIGVKK